MKSFVMNILTRFLLHLLAMQFNFRKSKQALLKSTIQGNTKAKTRVKTKTQTGWINFTLGIKTEDNKVHSAIRFNNGKASVYYSIPHDADTLLIFKNEEALYDMLRLPPNEIFNLLLKNEMRTKGNLSYLSAFNFYISIFMAKKHKKLLIQAKEADKKKRLEPKFTTKFSHTSPSENLGDFFNAKGRILIEL